MRRALLVVLALCGQGVGLRGTGVSGVAAGSIDIPECAENDKERLGCVPRDVDVVAAFLYS
jgi:hypothetical protein